PIAAQAPVGKRDENSVMFSLSALTARAGTTPGPVAAPPTKTTAAKDDSGLIDLKALADSATATASAAPAAPSFDPGLFPLGAPIQPVAVGAPAIALPIEAPPKNRTPLYLALGTVAAIGAIVGAFMVMKGGEEKPPPAPIPTEVATVAPAP